jgi:lipoprotein-anchoring transpeptidase ErfK/SrfK
VETCPVNCIQSIGAGAHVQTLGIGSTWIALSKASYGIHGTPESSEVGRAASHGCVRLTKGDAQRLASMISRSVPVNFRSRT